MLSQWQVSDGIGIAGEIVNKILTYDGTKLRNEYQAKFIASQVTNALNEYFALKEEEREFAESYKLSNAYESR